MKRSLFYKLCLLFTLLVCICSNTVHADRILFTYDASGNRVYSEKEILIRGDESQDDDKKPRHQDLSLCHITIHPNPTEGQLSVEIIGAESFDGASITIYSASGSIVYYDNSLDNENEIDLTPCPRGIYLLIIRIGGETSSWKIVRI
ncbi:MAG: T9SS type A sorting domain-containing protein [Bacteroidaceae bacterium]|nr:T9SS type A sorting domain-containing protein [Bacteroidaceae bacterium]